jgi:hypothetical protein
VAIADAAARRRWLDSEGVANLRSCIELAEAHATPWTKKIARSLPELAGVSEGWLERYAPA